MVVNLKNKYEEIIAQQKDQLSKYEKTFQTLQDKLENITIKAVQQLTRRRSTILYKICNLSHQIIY
jgi:hypothetical protein